MYNLRDVHGILKAKMPDKMAEVIMLRCHGEMKEKNFKDTGKTMVWTLLSDSVVGMRVGWLRDEALVYLWAGDYLEKAM